MKSFQPALCQVSLVSRARAFWKKKWERQKTSRRSEKPLDDRGCLVEHARPSPSFLSSVLCLVRNYHALRFPEKNKTTSTNVTFALIMIIIRRVGNSDDINYLMTLALCNLTIENGIKLLWILFSYFLFWNKKWKSVTFNQKWTHNCTTSNLLEVVELNLLKLILYR